MAGVARLARRVFCHERNRFAMLLGNFLQPVFEERVHIGHREGIGINKIDLVLPSAPFPLAALDRHAGRGHPVPDRPHQRLIPRRLHQVVINPVIARRLQVAITAGERGVITLVEEIELQFARATAIEPFLLQEFKLPAQN